MSDVAQRTPYFTKKGETRGTLGKVEQESLPLQYHRGLLRSRRTGDALVEYVRLPTPHGDLVLRDIAPDDLDALVDYWHGGGADVDFLGIDLERLGPREQTRERFLTSIRSERGRQAAVAFTIQLEDRIVGYTNVNFRERDGYVHVHFVDPAARNLGIASALIRSALKVFLAHLPIDRLVLEARTRNKRINHVVRKLGLKPTSTEYLDNPDGLAAPGEFNIYIVERSMLDDLR